ncbi:MAG: hypothetical protein IPM42_05480 [Saprospiraceae bacterium]|nr:hypothetical protein [Saprospiraceae bacterium]
MTESFLTILIAGLIVVLILVLSINDIDLEDRPKTGFRAYFNIHTLFGDEDQESEKNNDISDTNDGGSDSDS